MKIRIRIPLLRPLPGIRGEGAPVLLDDCRIIGRVISVDAGSGILEAELEIEDSAAIAAIRQGAIRDVSLDDAPAESALRRAIARILRR